jgi:hypothetical protein
MLPVQIAVADASSFELAGRRFGLIIAPMQLVQLLDGPAGRAGFLRSARAHLAPAGLLACAISEQLDAFDDSDGVLLPLPDVTFRAGVRYSSQPVAIRDEGDRVAIERIRETLAADGRRTATGDLIYLDRLDARTFEAEGRAAGLHPITPREIRQTDDHVGSSVVMLRA